MTDRDRLNADLCAVLTTLAEFPFSPASSVYLALGSDMARYELVASVLARAELAEVTTETLTITDNGRDMAAKIQGHLADQKGDA